MVDSDPKNDRDPLLEEILRDPLFQELSLRERISTLIEQARFHLRELGAPQNDDPQEFGDWLDKTHELEDVWTQALFLKGYLHSLRAAQGALNEGDHRAAFAAVSPWLEDPERVGRRTHSKGGAKNKLSSWHEHRLRRFASEYKRVKPHVSRSHVLEVLISVCEEYFGIKVSKSTLDRAIPKSILPPQGS